MNPKMACADATDSNSSVSGKCDIHFKSAVCVDGHDLIHLIVYNFDQTERELLDSLALVACNPWNRGVLCIGQDHVRPFGIVTMPLVVKDDTISVASEQEFVVTGELDTRHPGVVPVQDVDQMGALLLMEIKNPHRVVQVATHVQILSILTALVGELGQHVVQVIGN